MASITPPQASCCLVIRRTQNSFHLLKYAPKIERARTKSTRNRSELRVFASQGPRKRQRPPPGEINPRLHSGTGDEGWIGGSTSSGQQTKERLDEQDKDLLGDKFADLLNESSDSHYQFLGVSVDADMEEIKAAYRRLSKEYHPDTTSLPLKAASDKFMKLREVYDVLSKEESRRFYDWTLAQEAASRQAEKMRMKLEDPYEQELRNYKPVPDPVDRFGGTNMELSDQTMTALSFDVFVIIFAICCFVYVLVYKAPDYY
ncbi:NAD(P)H-quinone oxidoreductase subunit T, chloroplastic [Juglans microcarpa x Juglans regia]|uniref:NAD(P)H-quinone oxidoreductase subunit T, chloroplastic n=1 Tax=Juglans microcarpa x Juglans regia TaxID=2249226 RepID=UPI001B7E5404|nr:NAD(P)H-quinone oxidoreductase subunit T, chloroplastic [Juglans microcarpa x Juglans regia]